MKRKCERCGKMFYPTPSWGYKVNGKLFCAYPCYNAELTKLEEKQLQKIKKHFEQEEKKSTKKQKVEKKEENPLVKKEAPIKKRIEKPKKRNKKKPVVQYTADGEFVARYESSDIAAKAIGCHPSLITFACSGKRKFCKGFILKHGNETE